MALLVKPLALGCEIAVLEPSDPHKVISRKSSQTSIFEQSIIIG
jgi:hypothetical protein